MINDPAYANFVEQARLALLAQGGQKIALLGGDSARDDSVLLNIPGAPAVYVFSRLPPDPRGAQTTVDDLARNLAEQGLLSGAALALVIVFVARTLDPKVRDSLVRLAPTSFYSGLRPQVWVVDISASELHAKSSLRRPEGYEAVKEVATGIRGGNASAGQVSGAHRLQQFQAFYGLMQREQPIITYTLIAVNVCIFLYEFSSNALNSDSSLTNLGMEVPRLVQQGQWWRLITTMFLHGSVEHILFNMASLLAVGTFAERLYGRIRFLAIYFGSGIIASLASVVFWILQNQGNQGALGASGAIFGVAGALVVVRFQHSDLIPASIRRRITASVTPLIFISLATSALIPHVDSTAHVGGLVGGAAIALIVGMRTRLPGLDQASEGAGESGSAELMKGRYL